LVELGREVGTLRSSARQAKEEAREARSAKDDAERIAGELSGRVHDLEAKLEMAEQNLRVLLAAARGGKTSDEPVGSTEMEAILGVLKGG
jgi:predicted  nucleic acid-binding Zn-ribbon protein